MPAVVGSLCNGQAPALDCRGDREPRPEERNKDAVPLATVVGTTLLEMQASCPQGFVRTPALDAVLGGLGEKGVSLVVGLPGQGKTTLALQAMRQLAETQGLQPVLLTRPELWDQVFREEETLLHMRPRSFSRDDSVEGQRVQSYSDLSKIVMGPGDVFVDSHPAAHGKKTPTDSHKALPTRQRSMDEKKAPPTRERSTDGQKGTSPRERATDGQKAPPAREKSAEGQKGSIGRRASLDAKKTPSISDHHKQGSSPRDGDAHKNAGTPDSHKATTPRRASLDGQKAAPVTTTHKHAAPGSEDADKRKHMPAKDIQNGGPAVPPSKETSDISKTPSTTGASTDRDATTPTPTTPTPTTPTPDHARHGSSPRDSNSSREGSSMRESSTDSLKTPPSREMSSDGQKGPYGGLFQYVVLLEEALAPRAELGWQERLGAFLSRARSRRVPVILTSTASQYQDFCGKAQQGMLLADVHVVQLQNIAMWGKGAEEKILANFLQFHRVESSVSASSLVQASTSSPVGFPLSAAIYASVPSARQLGEDFFKDPIKFLVSHFKAMKTENPLAFYMLLLTWLKKGTLKVESLRSPSEKSARFLTKVQAMCGLKQAPILEEVERVAASLSGAYLCRDPLGGSYNFTHGCLRNCLAFAVCEADLKGVLDVCAIEHICEHIVTEGCRVVPSTTPYTVPRPQWKLLADRVLQELVSGNLEAALKHPSLRDQAFLRDVITVHLGPRDRKELVMRDWKMRETPAPQTGRKSKHVSLLALAVRLGVPDLARCLLLSEEITSLTGSERTRLLEEALIEACGTGDCGLVDLLLERGARVTGDAIRAVGGTGSDRDNALAAGLVRAAQDLELGDSHGQTLLHVAVVARRPAVVEALLQRGARADVEDKTGALPLHLICADSEGTQQEAVQRVGTLLLQKTPDVNHKNKARETPLLVAAQAGNVFMLEALLGHGANANIRDNTKNLPLHWYCAQVTRFLPRADSLRVGHLVIKSTSDINQRNNKGETPLHVAARSGKVHLVEILLNHGARADIEDDARALPLHRFCPKVTKYLSREDILRVAALLLERTPDVDHQTVEGRTPLHQAARYGSLVMVEVLLGARARADIQDNNGALPLNLFSLRPSKDVGRAEVRRVGGLLVKAVPDKGIQDTMGETPLHLAARAGNLLMTELLLRAKASARVEDDTGSLPLHWCGADAPANVPRRELERLAALLVEKTPDVNHRNINGETPLFLVAKSGHVSLVELLLRAKAKPDVRDHRNNLPLHCFCAHSASRGASREDIQRVGALLAQLTPNIDVRNLEGETPLHLAARAGNLAMVEVLLEQRAKASIKDNKGFLPLHEFCGESTASLLPLEETQRVGTLLVKKTSNVNHATWAGCTPLYSATLCGNLAMMEVLLNNGAKADLRDAASCLPLHFFCGLSVEDYAREDLQRVGSLLVQNTHYINQSNNKGETPLMRAAQQDSIYMVEILLKHGAKAYIDDEEGCLPIHAYSPKASPRLPQDDIERIGALLVEKTPDVQIADRLGRTPLHAAAASGSVYLVERLLKRGATADIPDVAGNLPLHLYSPHPSKVLPPREIQRVGKLLVERTPDLDQANKQGLTPLHLAAWAGSAHVVELLLNHGARADAEDKTWNLPLHWFCGKHERRMHSSDVQRVGTMLVERTPDIAHKNKKGHSPFHVAAQAENMLMVEIVMKHMSTGDFAKILPLHWYCQEPLHHTSREEVQRLGILLVQSTPDINQRNSKGETALHLAARSRNLYMLTTLLNHGASADLEDKFGWLPLHRLSYMAPIVVTLEDSSLANLQDLMGGDLAGLELVEEVEEEAEDGDGEDTDASEAAPGQMDLELAAQLLLQKTKDLDRRNRAGKTALHLAVKSKQHVMVEALVKQGARGDVPDSTGSLPLHNLCSECDIGEEFGDDLSGEFLHMGMLLFQSTSDVNQQNKRRQTPLHLAASSRNITLVEMLLAHGADTGIEDFSGSLPLHRLCKHSLRRRPNEVKQRVGSLFIKKTANLNHRNKKGETPMILAAKSGSLVLLDILQKHKARADLADNAKNFPLHWFCARTDCSSSRDLGVQRVGKLMVQTTPDVNAKNENGDTPLHMAGKAGNSYLLELLLQQGARTAARDKAGLLPLHCYAGHNQADRRVGALLARKSPDVNARTRHGETALHLAATSGSSGMLEALLKNGARTDLHDNGGSLPLHRLADRGPEALLDPRAVALLARKTPDVNHKNAAGDTALHVAARRLSSSVVRVLLEQGARADLEDAYGCLALHCFCASPDGASLEEDPRDVAGALLIQKNPDINHRNKSGETPLLLAAKAGRLRVVEALLKHGAKTDVEDNSGALALHWACVASALEVGDRKVLQRLGTVLVAATEDLDHRTTEGETALHLAAGAGCLLLLEALLRRGASADVEDSTQSLPLHRFCSLLAWFHLPHLEVKAVGTQLVQRTSDINRQNKDGDTPLHLALKTDNFLMAKVLLRNEARGDVANKAGALPMHLLARKLDKLASEKERRRVETLLIAKTPNINHQNRQGMTPLHLASKSSSLRAVQALLERHAVANLLDEAGNLALHWYCLQHKRAALKKKQEEESETEGEYEDDDDDDDDDEDDDEDEEDYDDSEEEDEEELVEEKKQDEEDSEEDESETDTAVETIEEATEDEEMTEDEEDDDARGFVSEAEESEEERPRQEEDGEKPEYNISSVLRQLAKLLLQRTPNLAHKDKRGRTPLHIAARGGNFCLLETLLAADSPAHVEDDNGNLPLHSLCSAPTRRASPKERERVGSLLAHRTLEVDVKNKAGETPLSVAIALQDHVMMGVLEKMAPPVPRVEGQK